MSGIVGPEALDDLEDRTFRQFPLAWIETQVKTVDEHDSQSPIKPFPIDKPYLRESARTWLANNLLFIEKSRQLCYSWLLIILHLWLAQFTPHRRIFFQSKREDDARAMLDRAWLVWENQSPWIKSRHSASRNASKIWFPNGSEIIGIPHGPHILRQYTSSAVLSDEQAFQEDAEDSWGAAMPTILGGGRFTGISSAHPGFFQSAVESSKAKAHDQKELLKGLTLWQGKGTGFSVLRAHYTCDPDVKTQSKVASVKESYESSGRGAWFKKEYEIDYGALSGQLIWPELSSDFHLIDPFPIPDDWIRYRAIDPGVVNPCAVLWIAMSPPGWRGCVSGEMPLPVMVAYREMYQTGLTVHDAAHIIKALSGRERYAATLIDPSSKIHRGNEAFGRSWFEQFQHEGIDVVEAYNRFEATSSDVATRLKVYGSTPGLLFFRSLANTWREITNYRYQELTAKVAETSNPREAPVKKDDHLSDTLRYLCSHAPLKLPDTTTATTAPAPRGTLGHLLKRQDEIHHMRGLLGNAMFGRGATR